jgi:hypothetical protein
MSILKQQNSRLRWKLNFRSDRNFNLRVLFAISAVLAFVNSCGRSDFRGNSLTANEKSAAGSSDTGSDEALPSVGEKDERNGTEARNPKQITVQWDYSDIGQAGFIINRKVNATTYTQLALVNPTILTFSDTDVEASTEYCYQVQAYNADGHSDNSNEICLTE